MFIGSKRKRDELSTSCPRLALFTRFLFVCNSLPTGPRAALPPLGSSLQFPKPQPTVFFFIGQQKIIAVVSPELRLFPGKTGTTETCLVFQCNQIQQQINKMHLIQANSTKLIQIQTRSSKLKQTQPNSNKFSNN